LKAPCDVVNLRLKGPSIFWCRASAPRPYSCCSRTTKRVGGTC
jgi:hypothetical protein